MSGEEKGKSNLLLNAFKSVLGRSVSDGDISGSIPESDDIYGDSDTGLSSKTTDGVEIVIDKNVRTKYRNGWVGRIRTAPPIEVVIHGTAGGKSCSGLLNWMYNRNDSRYNSGIGLFHNCIGRGDKGEKDGLIVEVIDSEYWVNHSTSDTHDKLTIGIELLNPSLSNRDSYTDAQYDSLFSLIFDHLMNLYPIQRIAGHRYNIWRWNSKKTAQKYDKICPGNFDWSRLDAELENREYSYKVDGVQLRYDIAQKD